MLFDEHKFAEVYFVAKNLRCVPLIEPGSVDLCFSLETVSEMKIQVENLLSVKSKVDKLNDLLKAKQESGNTNILVPTANIVAYNLTDRDHSNVGQSRPPDTMHSTSCQIYNSVAATGMKNDTNLKVNMPARDATSKREVPNGQQLHHGCLRYTF